MNGSARRCAHWMRCSHHLSDPRNPGRLARLFPVAESAGVQTAIAGVLIRSDYQAIATPSSCKAAPEPAEAVTPAKT